MAFIEKSYLGSGRVFIDNLEVGNVPQLDFQIEENIIELLDTTSSGGGVRNTVRRIASVKIAMTMTDYNADNLAQAYFGSTSNIASSAIVDESITTPASVTKDILVPTAKMIDVSVAPVVTSDPAGTTYVVDVDYEVIAAGIIIISSGSITSATGLLVSYTAKDVDVIEAITGSPIAKKVIFSGLNEAQSDAPTIITAHRVRFGAAENTSYKGDDFGQIELSGDVLSDSSIVGANLSKFFQVQLAA